MLAAAGIGLGHYLTVGAILFTLGVFGIFLNRKNIIIILMSVELILLAVNINFEKARAGFISYLPLGIGVAALLFAELAALLYRSILSPADLAEVRSPIPDALHVTNAQAIGRVLYTDYLIAFQLAGVILLVAMIGAIVLTHRQRTDTRGQNVGKQNRRRPDEATFNVKPEVGKGVQL